MKGGLSFLDILTLEFIGFRLAGCIDWSWILVFAPFILGIIISAVLDEVKKTPPH